MEFVQNICGIAAVLVVVIINAVVIARGIASAVRQAKELREATEEEKAAAKEYITENLQQIIFGLVTEAEKELGGGTGKLKSAKVAGWIYDKIPDDIKPLFTAAEIQRMIERALREAQEYWNKNSKAREYIDSGAVTMYTAEIESTAPPDGVDVDEIVNAVAERIGEAIAEAAGLPQNAPEDAGDKLPIDTRESAEAGQDGQTAAENVAPTE